MKESFFHPFYYMFEYTVKIQDGYLCFYFGEQLLLRYLLNLSYDGGGGGGGGQIFYTKNWSQRKKIRYVAALDLIKCLKQIE